MEPHYVIVYPDQAYGVFESYDAAKQYLRTTYASDEDMHLDHTWSIKPLYEAT
jgi:hypothetical protein